MKFRIKSSVLTMTCVSLFAGGAFAQTNITIYGVTDVGVAYSSPKRSGAGNTVSLETNGAQGSRIGFRGVENLGAGLSAIFALESGFAMDTGALGYSGRLWGRQGWVGLNSQTLGTIAMGRVASFSAGAGSFDMWLPIDPFKTAFGLAGFNSTFSSGALRLDNTVLYRSPDINGVQAGVLYSFQSVSGSPISENPGIGNNNRTIGTGIRYAKGPLFAAMTLDVIKPGASTSGALAGRTNPDQRDFQIGGVYDFGAATVHVAYANQKNHSLYSPVSQDNSIVSTIDPLDRPDAESYLLGLTIPVAKGRGKILTSYQYRDGKPLRTSSTTTYEADRRIFGIAYQHYLSKRTSLYVSAADSFGKKSIAAGTAATDPYNRREYRVGINHNF